MAISLRAAGTAVTSGSNSIISLVPGKPTGTVAGDVMLAYLSMTGTQTSITAPSGWTEVHHANDSGQSTNSNLYVFYKVAGASEPSTYTFSWTVSGGGIAVIDTYTGVDTVSPVGEKAITTQSVDSLTRATPSITTAGDRWIVSSFTSAQGDTWTGTDTERHDVARSAAASLMVQDSNAVVGAGSISRSATCTNVYQAGCQSIVALTPYVPQPDAGPDQTVASGATVTLDGTDPAGATVTARLWTCTTKPSGVTVTITNSTSADATVTLATAGHYVFTYQTTVGGVDLTDVCHVYVTTTTGRVETSVSNAGGWTGTATDVSDNDDSTFDESIDSPNGGTRVWLLQPLAAGAKTITVRYSASVDTGAPTGLIELLNGPTGTAFASLSCTGATTTVQEATHDLTSGELAAITDLTNVHVRYSATA